MQVPIQIKVEGKSVMGILHIPESRAKGTPIIIVCNGLNGNRVEAHRMLVHAGRKAEKHGVILLRFDCRGLGLSGGEFWQTSMKEKTKDILSMIEFISGCFQHENHTLILLGYSDGAKVATKVAKISKEVFGLATWSPVLLSANSNKTTKSRFCREPLTKEIVTPFGGLWIGKDYLKEIMQEKDFYDIFLNFSGPKLCIFGTQDKKTRIIRRKLTSENALISLKVVNIQGAGHVYQKKEWSQKVIDETIDWTKWVGEIHYSSEK